MFSINVNLAGDIEGDSRHIRVNYKIKNEGELDELLFELRRDIEHFISNSNEGVNNAI